MPNTARRTFSRAFKLNVIERMDSGESATALACELQVKREILYRWSDAYRQGGEAALRDAPGRPSKAEAVVMAESREAAANASDMNQMRRRILALEVRVCEQQRDLEAFRRLVRQIGASLGPLPDFGAPANFDDAVEAMRVACKPRH